MKTQLQIAAGSFRILDRRVRAAGLPGLTAWTSSGNQAIDRTCANLRAFSSELAEIRAEFERVLPQLEAFAGKQRRRGGVFAAFERANARLAGAIEKIGLCVLLAAMLGACASGDGDDLARRAARSRRGKRREDVVEVCDAETGDVL